MRCLSGPKVGLGHLMRCREVARYLREQGHRAVIMGPRDDLKTAVDDDLFHNWVAEPDIFDAEADCAAFLAFCKRHRAQHANMDDYRITPRYQKALYDAKIRTLQQFDASKPWPFWADLVVNAGPAEHRADYAAFLPNPETQTLFGPAYAVIRPQFTQLEARANGRPLKRLLVSFGGGDDRGMLPRVVSALSRAQIAPVELVVVSAGANPHAASYIDMFSKQPSVSYHIDPQDMPRLMHSCDGAIIAGGTMSYEAAICGLPLILIALAPNQIRACKGWQERIQAIFLGTADQVADKDIIDAVQGLQTNETRRRTMSAAGRAAIDGRGVIRLVETLLKQS